MSGLLKDIQDQKNEVARIEALKDFFIPDNIEQKTNLTAEQARAISSSEAQANYCLRAWKVKRQVLIDYTYGYKLHAVSSPPSKMNGRDMAQKVLSTDIPKEERKMGWGGPKG